MGCFDFNIDESSIDMKSTKQTFHELEVKNKVDFGNECEACKGKMFANDVCQLWNGKRYHAACFRCSVCDCVLRHQNFKSQYQVLYCFHCYEEEILIPEAANCMTYQDEKALMSYLEPTFDFNPSFNEMFELTKQF